MPMKVDDSHPLPDDTLLNLMSIVTDKLVKTLAFDDALGILIDGAMELLASIPSPTAQGGGRGPIAGQGAAPAPAPAPGPAPMPGPQGAGGIPPEVQNVIMAASQALGIPPEQVMAMGPERVQQLMQARAQAPGG